MDFALPLENVSQNEISNTSHHESNFEMDANCTEFLHKGENISHPDLITERKIEKVEQEKVRNIDKDLEEEFDLTSKTLDERSRLNIDDDDEVNNLDRIEKWVVNIFPQLNFKSYIQYLRMLLDSL